MTHWKLRLASSAVTLATVLSPGHARCQTTSPSAPVAAVRMDHVSIVATGHGSPVILIPGLSSPREIWAVIAPALAERHRVYLVQVNGFGGDAPGANLSAGVLDGVVADLHAYMARERIAAPAVIGHSMGGLIGLMLAKAHPADVGRLMVVDALPFAGTMFLATATVAMVEPQAGAMRAAMAGGYGRPADPAIARATADRLALKPDSRAKVAGWFAAADPRVSGEAMYEDLTTDLRPAMAGIATPITLVYPWSAALPEEHASALYHAAYKDAPHVGFVPVPDKRAFRDARSASSVRGRCRRLPEISRAA